MMQKKLQNVPAVISDGFDGDSDEDRNSIIKGRKLKFTLDFKWECGDEVILPEREFLAIEVIKVVQKWVPESRGPVDTQVLGADEKFPDIEALNNKAPRNEWSDKFGKKKGPWQTAMVVYLLDEQTMGLLTYVADTVGGLRAVRELRESTRLARKVRGSAVFPVVTLGDEFMPTQYGGRQRPSLKIKRYVPIGEQAQPRQIEHVEQKADELNDPLPESWGREKKKRAAV
jgi:hypothetical protein